MPEGSSFLGLFLGVTVSALVGGTAGWIVANQYKPKPVVVQPTISMGVRRDTAGVQSMTRTEQLRAAASWGDLDQKEIDALAEALKSIPHAPLTIFCENDSKCGDMQLGFDNAFETAHWDTKLEKPLIDDTVGVGTSSKEILNAIDEATHGRLAVKLIKKNAPYEVLVIGQKPK